MLGLRQAAIQVSWVRTSGCMLTATQLRDPVLINTIGHTAGLLLFGLIIALLIRDRRSHPILPIRLSVVAAALALLWNFGSLIALGWGKASSFPIAVVMTASFSVLSFLPAVLLQVALQAEQRWIWTAGYAVSAMAAVLHFSELFSSNMALHQIALILIAVGFGVLVAIAFFVRRVRRSPMSVEPTECFSLACLLLFTSSFLHFGYAHVSSPWAAEIAWHHVGIPVALIVLLRDYRFLLLDTFIRFLMNFCIATFYVGILLVLNQRFRLSDAIGSSKFLMGLAMVGLCLSLILFAYARNGIQGWIGRVIFQRKDLDKCIRRIVNLASEAPSGSALLSGALRRSQAIYALINSPYSTDQSRQTDLIGRRFCLVASSLNGFRRKCRGPKRKSRSECRAATCICC